MEQNIEFEENAFCKSIDFRIDSKRINLPHLDEERARQLEIGLKLNRNIELIEFERLAISNYTDLDMVFGLLEKYCKNVHTIKSFDQNFNLYPNLIYRICDFFTQLPYLREITFGSEDFQGDDLTFMIGLSNFLKYNKTVEVLYISFSRLLSNYYTILEVLYLGLKDNKTMKALCYFEYDPNHRFDREYNEIFRLLAENTSLESITFSGSDFSEEAKEEFRKINSDEKTKLKFYSFE